MKKNLCCTTVEELFVSTRAVRKFLICNYGEFYREKISKEYVNIQLYYFDEQMDMFMNNSCALNKLRNEEIDFCKFLFDVNEIKFCQSNTSSTIRKELHG